MSAVVNSWLHPMKNPMIKTWGIWILAWLIVVPAAFAKDLELNKRAGDYEIRMIIDRNPPIIGPNQVEVEIKDAATESVITDAEVMVNYYMPPMPRMAPMNYNTIAGLKGEKYRSTMDINMAGPWIIRIVITRAGKRVSAKFNFDAQ